MPPTGLPGPRQVDGLDLATSELRESILQLCRTTSVWSEVGFPTSVEMARSDRSRPRQGQDVGVEVAVVELSEGLPPHEIGGVDGQPVVLCAHRLPSQHAVVAVLLPHRGHLPRLGAAEVLEGHGQLAQDAVPRLLQLAVRPPLLERPSLRRRARRRAQLQLGVKRGHQREELRQLLVRAGPEVVDHAGQARGEDVHAVHEPQLLADLQRTWRQRWL